MTARIPRLLLTAAVFAALLAGLTACGKKGSPRPPEGQESEYTYPHAYPAPATVTPNGAGSEERSGPLSIFNDDERTTTKRY